MVFVYGTDSFRPFDFCRAAGQSESAENQNNENDEDRERIRICRIVKEKGLLLAAGENDKRIRVENGPDATAGKSCIRFPADQEDF